MSDRALHIINHLRLAREHQTEQQPLQPADASASRKNGYANPSPFLHGNFEPVKEELLIKNIPVIHGRIPSDLNGEYIKNGPNAFLEPPEDAPYHWFDGDGMLHGIIVDAGAASYVNKWVVTERLVQDKETKSAIYEFGELERGNLSALMQVYNDKTGFRSGRAQTSVVYHGKRLLVLDESDVPYQVAVPFLETIGRWDYNKKLSHVFTAHPKVDGRNGEMLVFGYTISPTPPFLIHYSTVSAAGELLNTISLEIRAPVFMHDFAITNKHTIFFDVPAHFRFDISDRSPWTHDRSVSSMFGVIPRHSRNPKEIKWFESPSCMIFHTAGAWDEGNCVHLVTCRANTYKMNFDDIKNQDVWLFPYEWVFDLSTGKTVRERQLCEVRCDFPMINPAYVGYKFRYLYCASYRSSEDNIPYYDGLVKLDLETLQTTWLQFPAHMSCAEWQYVSRPNPKAEDDGYLLTFVFDSRTSDCFFYIVDAHSPSIDNPIAIVRTPQRVPYGFHGTWLSAKQIVDSIKK